MLDDIGNPKTQAVADALGVSVRTVRRWRNEDNAPRPALLALFWLTRWGMSVVDAEAVNQARAAHGLAQSLSLEVDRLRSRLERMGAIAEFGCVNDPAAGVPLRPPASIPNAQAKAPASDPSGQPDQPPVHPVIPVRNGDGRTAVEPSPAVRRFNRKAAGKTKPSEFRLIRTYSDEHNLARLRHHIRRLQKAPAHRRLGARLRPRRRAMGVRP